MFVLDDKKIMPDLYFYRDPEEQKKEEAIEEVDEKREADVFEGSSKPADVSPLNSILNPIHSNDGLCLVQCSNPWRRSQDQLPV